MEALLCNTAHLHGCHHATSNSHISKITPQSHCPLKAAIRVPNPHGLLGRSRLWSEPVQGCGLWRWHALASKEKEREQEGEVEVMQSRRGCECHDLYDVLVPYVDAWRWQQASVEEKVAMLGRGEDFDETLLVLQHPSVYTLGTRSSEANLKFDADDPPFELHRTERGGEVTYHGPGQLVMYPILNLRHHNMDLHWYLRTLEEVVIGALDMACGIQAHRIDGLTGVWVDNQKVVQFTSKLLLRNVGNKHFIMWIYKLYRVSSS